MSRETRIIHKTSPSSPIEATVSSKGQITLPQALRSRLGIRVGSRIRFTVHPGGDFEAHPILCELEDLWAAAEQANQPGRVMTFEKMNRAKARRPGR